MDSMGFTYSYLELDKSSLTQCDGF